MIKKMLKLDLGAGNRKCQRKRIIVYVERK